MITNKRTYCSSRFINYFFNHSYKYKINIIISLDHAIILSHTRFHNSNIKNVKEILSNNCFPSHIINKRINIRLNYLKNHTNTLNTDHYFRSQGTKLVLPFCYIKEFSNNLCQNLKKFKFDVLFSVLEKLNNVIRVWKDKIWISRQTEVVYM